MNPGAIICGSGSVQVENFALVPSLIFLLHGGEVEGGQPHGGVGVYPWGAPLVHLIDVGIVTVVPDVDGYLVVLPEGQRRVN